MLTPSVSPELFDRLDAVLRKAKALGADAAEGVFSESMSLSAAVQGGRLADMERSENAALSMRVFIGQRTASVSTHVLDREKLDALATQAVAMARAAPEDPYAVLANEQQLAKTIPALELFDSTEVEAGTLREAALELEAEARTERKITNIEEARASWGVSGFAYITTKGFRGGYKSTGHSLSIETVAGTGTEMVRDYDYATSLWRQDLRSIGDVARVATQRTISRLGARKMPTARIPVVLSPRIASRLLHDVLGAISGSAVARQSTFLKDALGQGVFAPSITITDNPHLRRGLRSRPFDGEGLPPHKRQLVEQGVLQTFMHNLSSAKQLGTTSTGHASRHGGVPGISCSNVTLEAGRDTPEDLIADIHTGFYVTELMGHGANTLTGDFSQGAAGFWIEKGQIAFPVHEMTIAGNLKDMLKNMLPANDLVIRYGVDAPTLRIEGMAVAGS